MILGSASFNLLLLGFDLLCLFLSPLLELLLLVLAHATLVKQVFKARLIVITFFFSIIFVVWLLEQ